MKIPTLRWVPEHSVAEEVPQFPIRTLRCEGLLLLLERAAPPCDPFMASVTGSNGNADTSQLDTSQTQAREKELVDTPQTTQSLEKEFQEVAEKKWL